MAVMPIFCRFNLFQQIRLLLRNYRDGHTPDATLLDERMRIISTLSLNAPNGQVESIRQPSSDSPVDVVAWYNGLTGSMGALPTAYSEWLIERQFRYSDVSAKAFIDLFGHRLYCLDYLAWQKNHLYARAESQSVLPLSNEILALSGLLRSGVPTTLANHASQFASPVRSMVNLERWLSTHFEVPVKIIPFTGGWREVEPHTCCQLGNLSQHLATAPMIGTMRREVHAHFDVILGPMSSQKSLRFTSRQGSSRELWSCIRSYVGPVLDFSISLTICSKDLAPRPLGMGAIGLDISLGKYANSHLYHVRLAEPTV